jgi:carbon monoxide dehydrogenase subunit G
MEVSGEYTFDAPQEITWKALQDPDVLSSIMPGGEDFEEIGENEYSGMLNIRVGPVQGKFKGTIKLSDIVPPESYQMDVDGKGAPGFVKANGGLRLTGQGEKTHMSYEGTAQVGGRIASVGQRLLDSSARSVIRQSLEGLNEYLRVQVESQSSGEAAGEPADELEKTPEPAKKPEYTPPSQTEIAMNVAKDVAGDVVPPRYRPVVAAIAVILVILILYLIFS